MCAGFTSVQRSQRGEGDMRATYVGEMVTAMTLTLVLTL